MKSMTFAMILLSTFVSLSAYAQSRAPQYKLSIYGHSDRSLLTLERGIPGQTAQTIYNAVPACEGYRQTGFLASFRCGTNNLLFTLRGGHIGYQSFEVASLYLAGNNGERPRRILMKCRQELTKRTIVHCGEVLPETANQPAEFYRTAFITGQPQCITFPTKGNIHLLARASVAYVYSDPQSGQKRSGRIVFADTPVTQFNCQDFLKTVSRGKRVVVIHKRSQNGSLVTSGVLAGNMQFLEAFLRNGQNF